MLDTMGTRYHVLPSECITRATSFDLFVLTNAIEYYRRQNDGPKELVAPNWSEDEMKDMMNYAKGLTG